MTDLEYARLRKQISDTAAEVYTPEGVRIWMTSRNRMLDMRTPEQAIRDGDGREVLDYITNLAEGGFA